MIKKYSLLPLQTAINYALSLDESMPEKLGVLEGRVIEIIIEPLEINFYIQITKARIKLRGTHTGEPDTVIRSSPLGFIRLSFLPASKARSLFNDKITLKGNIETGQQLKKIIDTLDIDWETHIARFTGDVVAYQLGSLFRQGMAFKNRFTDSMQQNTKDFLQEEVRLMPVREEVDDFFKEIDELAMTVERMEARINATMNSNDTN
jgi:ubiquinone biosynthesis protein UbiJ